VGGGAERVSPIYDRIEQMPFRASRSFDHIPPNSGNPNELHVRGRVIDCISYKIHIFDMHKEQFIEHMIENLKLEEVSMSIRDETTSSIDAPSF
jgi:hypothetical protein